MTSFLHALQPLREYKHCCLSNHVDTKERGRPGSKVHTTHANTTAMANADPPVPSCKPTVAARAVTVAECEDGIPPELTILLESHLLSLTLHIYKHILQRTEEEKENK